MPELPEYVVLFALQLFEAGAMVRVERTPTGYAVQVYDSIADGQVVSYRAEIDAALRNLVCPLRTTWGRNRVGTGYAVVFARYEPDLENVPFPGTDGMGV